MNCKEHLAIPTPSNDKIYYAPAASTRGNKVTIYRYSLIRLSEEYHREAYLIADEIEAAKIRYKWARLLTEQLPHYSGDRRELRNFTKKLAQYTYYTLFLARKEEKKQFYRNPLNRHKRFRSRLISAAFLAEVKAFALRFGGYL